MFLLHIQLLSLNFGRIYATFVFFPCLPSFFCSCAANQRSKKMSILNNKGSVIDQTSHPLLFHDVTYEDLLRKPIEGEQTVYELTKTTKLTDEENKVLQHFRSAYHLQVHVGLRQHLPCNCREEICWHNTAEQLMLVTLPSYFCLDDVEEDGTYLEESLKSDIMSNYNCRFVRKMQVIKKPCVKKEMQEFLNKL